MTEKQIVINEAKRNLACLQAAVREELEKRAKLGLTAVVADAQGRPVHVPAAELVAQLRAQEAKKAKPRRRGRPSEKPLPEKSQPLT